MTTRLIKYSVWKQGGGCVSSLETDIPHCVATADTSVNPITLSLSAVAHTYHPRPWESEAGGMLRVQGEVKQYSETLLLKK